MLSDFRDVIYHCLKCGACREAYEVNEQICPSGIRYGFDSYYAIGRISLARAVVDGEIEIDANLMRRIYSCTSCGACDEQCHDAVGVDPLRVIEALKQEAVHKGKVPPEVRHFLEAMQKRGNPYHRPSRERSEWAEGLEVPLYDGHEYLLFVGCVGSYDERGRNISRSAAKLLKHLNVSFGILGSEELCDGNEVLKTGETDLFEEIAGSNINAFEKYGVKKILVFSPHSFNALKNEYPLLGGSYEVLHISQLLEEKIRSMEFQQFEAGRSLKAVYHDPCFLGRLNGIYEAPRKVLKSIPGLEFAEMTRNRNNALCCGGGGGNFFTGMLESGERDPARARLREAIDSGAEILAVSCPICAKMLDDAVKAEWAEDRISVLDITEIATRCLNL